VATPRASASGSRRPADVRQSHVEQLPTQPPAHRSEIPAPGSLRPAPVDTREQVRHHVASSPTAARDASDDRDPLAPGEPREPLRMQATTPFWPIAALTETTSILPATSSKPYMCAVGFVEPHGSSGPYRAAARIGVEAPTDRSGDRVRARRARRRNPPRWWNRRTAEASEGGVSLTGIRLA